MGLVVQFLQYLNWPLASVAAVLICSCVYYKQRKEKESASRCDSFKRQVFDGEDSDDYTDFTPSLEEKEHVPYSGSTVVLPGGAKQFYEIVSNRRSIRKFSSKSIPIEVIRDCVRAAGTSPSGAHTEPWTFCVISDTNLKAQIREIVEAEELVNYEQRMSKQWTTDLRPFKTNHIKEYLTTAPYLVLVFKQTYGMRKDGKKKQHYYNEISTSISVGVLLCALQAAGLSSLVTTPLNCGPALKVLLNRPANEKLLVLMPVGYVADDCTVPDLKRKDLSEILVEY